MFAKVGSEHVSSGSSFDRLSIKDSLEKKGELSCTGSIDVTVCVQETELACPISMVSSVGSRVIGIHTLFIVYK